MNKAQLANAVSSLGLPDFIVNFFVSHPYEIIFVSLLFGGGIILFPAFYLALLGILKLWNILGIMLLATVVTDTFWYLVGAGLLPQFIESRIEKGKYMRKLTEITEGKELMFLFYSKFIYGTRIAMQIFCGARKVNFPAYLSINMGAVVVLGFLYYGVIRFTAAGLDSLGDLKYKLGIVLSVTMLVVGALHFIIHRLLRKRLLASET